MFPGPQDGKKRKKNTTNPVKLDACPSTSTTRYKKDRAYCKKKQEQDGEEKKLLLLEDMPHHFAIRYNIVYIAVRVATHTIAEERSKLEERKKKERK